MTRVPLTGADLYDWIALRRVSGGGIAKAGCSWFDSGHRVPGYVDEALVALRAAGLVVLADPDSTAMARAALTDAGADRLEQLCQQRDTALQAHAAQLAATRRGQAQPTGHRCPTCQALPTVPVPDPQGHNPPAAERPPDEHAPGDQPDPPPPDPRRRPPCPPDHDGPPGGC